MTILLFLMPAALFLGLLGLAGFLWALRTGQFEDLDGAAQRILLDEEMPGDRLRLSSRPSPRPPTP